MAPRRTRWEECPPSSATGSQDSSLQYLSMVDPIWSYDSHSPATSVNGNPILPLVQAKKLRRYPVSNKEFGCVLFPAPGI